MRNFLSELGIDKNQKIIVHSSFKKIMSAFPNVTPEDVITTIQESIDLEGSLIMLFFYIGKFLRAERGSIFNVSQLARAISNLPGYLINGNTPQGIFSIQGIDTSKNVLIGGTPNIQLVLPFEADAKQFFHSSENLIWDKALYKKLLPESWQEYPPIYEAFYAGEAGRNEIIAHGTTIDLDFYVGQPYYPHTPTLGCLCTVEVWSGDDGKRIYSDQSALIDALKNLLAFKGHLIVVEIDDKKSPVTLKDILSDVLHAEKNFVKLEE